MKFCIYILIFLVCFYCQGQETLINAGFSIRDFFIDDQTLLYIEKRDIKNYNLNLKTRDTLINPEGFFIGGYGLKLSYDKTNKKIVTASNELIRDISSIRFYDTEKKNINKFHVYYTTKLVDFLISPKDSMFFLSKKNKWLEVYRYNASPTRYKKIDSIKTSSFSRKLRFNSNQLFYITDKGEVIIYNTLKRSKKLLYKHGTILVNFCLSKDFKKIYVTTSQGQLIIIDINGKTKPIIVNLGDSIIEAIDIVADKYIITGNWKGKIKIIDIKTLSVIKEFNNKKRIIKILAKDNYFYTSSSDRTIKRWKIN